MTSEELRSNREVTSRMAEIVNDPIFQLVLATLKADGEDQDADVDATELASVRILSKQRGRASAFNDLLLSAIPIETEERPRIPKFGLDMSDEDAAAALNIPLPS